MTERLRGKDAPLFRKDERMETVKIQGKLVYINDGDITQSQLFIAAKNFLGDISAGNLDPESMQVLAKMIFELEMP